MKKERQEQILRAYEACVAVYGLEGATLERVAEQAGLARALIRHNVGNREDLQEALVRRFLETSADSFVELVESIPEGEDRLRVFVERLFEPGYTDSTFILVSSALIAAGERDIVLARKLRKWVTDFMDAVEHFLTLERPDAPSEDLKAVAAGIVGLYFNVESLAPLGQLAELRLSSKAAADILLDRLMPS